MVYAWRAVRWRLFVWKKQGREWRLAGTSVADWRWKSGRLVREGLSECPVSAPQPAPGRQLEKGGCGLASSAAGRRGGGGGIGQVAEQSAAEERTERGIGAEPPRFLDFPMGG